MSHFGLGKAASQLRITRSADPLHCPTTQGGTYVRCTHVRLPSAMMFNAFSVSQFAPIGTEAQNGRDNPAGKAPNGGDFIPRPTLLGGPGYPSRNLSTAKSDRLRLGDALAALRGSHCVRANSPNRML